jgi:hypothetical protein
MRKISKILTRIYRSRPQKGMQLVFIYFRGSDDFIMQKVYIFTAVNASSGGLKTDVLLVLRSTYFDVWTPQSRNWCSLFSL